MAKISKAASEYIAKKIRTELQVIDIPTAKSVPIIEMRPVPPKYRVKANLERIKWQKENKAAYCAYKKKWHGLNLKEVHEYRAERYMQARKEALPAINEMRSRIQQMKAIIGEYTKAIDGLRLAVRKYR